MDRGGWQWALLCSQGGEFCARCKQGFGQQNAIDRMNHTIETRLAQIAVTNNAGDSS